MDLIERVATLVDLTTNVLLPERAQPFFHNTQKTPEVFPSQRFKNYRDLARMSIQRGDAQLATRRVTFFKDLVGKATV